MRMFAGAVFAALILLGESRGLQPESTPQRRKAGDPAAAAPDEFAPPRVRTELELADYLPIFALIGVLLVGAIGIALAHRWLQRSKESDLSVNDHLSEFRRLKAQGELSDEEFNKIKSVLGEKIRQEVGLEPKEKRIAPTPPADSEASADEEGEETLDEGEEDDDASAKTQSENP